MFKNLEASGAGAFGRADGVAVNGLLRVGCRIIDTGAAAGHCRHSEVLRSRGVHHGAAGGGCATGHGGIEGGVGSRGHRIISNGGICGRCIAFVMMLLVKRTARKSQHSEGNCDAGCGIKSVGFHGFCGLNTSCVSNDMPWVIFPSTEA